MVATRDLLRFSPSFRIGAIILVIVAIMLALSFVSPFKPDVNRVVPRNKPPSTEFLLGTNANGQDVFWMLTYAIRNTLIVAGMAVIIGRSIGIASRHDVGLHRWRVRPGGVEHRGQFHRHSAPAAFDPDRLNSAWAHDDARTGSVDWPARLGVSIEALSRPDFEFARARIYQYRRLRRNETAQDRHSGTSALLDPVYAGRYRQRIFVCDWL